jgi:hypothetical protein
MPIFDDRTALVTFQATNWSGWERESYSIVTSAQLKVTKGMALTPVTLGFKAADYEQIQCLFYEVLVERIVEDRVLFGYRNVVIENPDGTMNLSAPQSGRFILRPGESMRLCTPTMDAGTSVMVTLNEIR